MPKRSSKPRERSPPRGRLRRPRSGRRPFRPGAAKGPGVTRQALSRPVSERTAISVDMTVPLSKTFGSSLETRLCMQMAYDLRQAWERADRISVERFAA